MNEDKAIAQIRPRIKYESGASFWWQAGAVAAVLLFAFLCFPDALGLGTQILIMILFAMSLDLALGYAGIVTLGHAVFFGTGAYAAGLTALHVSANPLIGLLAATGSTALLGVLIGLCILRSHGISLVVLTLAIASLVSEIASQARGITGGDDGLQGYQISPLFGILKFDIWNRTGFIYCSGILFGWFLIAICIVRSPYGRSVEGIRQNHARMRASGSPVWQRRYVMFCISAAMAGSAGALSAQTTQLVALNSFSLFLSGGVVVMLVLGGVGRLYGAFLGATVYMLVHDYSSNLDPFYWMFSVGAMLILSVLFLDNGLVGACRVILPRVGLAFKRVRK